MKVTIEILCEDESELMLHLSYIRGLIKSKLNQEADGMVLNPWNGNQEEKRSAAVDTSSGSYTVEIIT